MCIRDSFKYAVMGGKPAVFYKDLGAAACHKRRPYRAVIADIRMIDHRFGMVAADKNACAHALKIVHAIAPETDFHMVQRSDYIGISRHDDAVKMVCPKGIAGCIVRHQEHVAVLISLHRRIYAALRNHHAVLQEPRCPVWLLKVVPPCGLRWQI